MQIKNRCLSSTCVLRPIPPVTGLILKFEIIIIIIFLLILLLLQSWTCPLTSSSPSFPHVKEKNNNNKKSILFMISCSHKIYIRDQTLALLLTPPHPIPIHNLYHFHPNLLPLTPYSSLSLPLFPTPCPTPSHKQPALGILH